MTWPLLPPDLVVARVDGRTVVCSGVSGELWALDPVAALVVEQRHWFAGLEDAAALLHGVLGGDSVAIRQQLAALDHALHPPPARARQPIARPFPMTPAPPSTRAAFERRIDCLGAAVLVRCHDPAIAAVVAPLIAEHPPGAAAAHVIDLWTSSEGIVVARNGAMLTDRADLWTAMSQLIGALTLLAMDSGSPNLRVHAGAIGREGRAIVVAGAANQGKSSTVVELVASGAAFITDEIVELDVQCRAVTGFPRAIGLEGPIRERHPALRPTWWDERWWYPRWPVAPSCVGATAPGGHLVGIAVLEHDPNGPLSAAPLDALDALARVGALVFNSGALAAQLTEIGDLLAEIPVILIRHDGAVAAAQAIREWGVL
jgi:hypothetical protein